MISFKHNIPKSFSHFSFGPCDGMFFLTRSEDNILCEKLSDFQFTRQLDLMVFSRLDEFFKELKSGVNLLNFCVSKELGNI